jgi:arginyl-tRNA synthetase
VFHAVIQQILSAGAEYGRALIGAGQRVHIEFVSANPTGPLHVGHGRSAAYGDVVANLLEAVGFSVHREYYVNDAGRQMKILALSVWLRYLEEAGESIHFPAKAYQGDYIKTIAHDLKKQAKDSFYHHAKVLYANLSMPSDKATADEHNSYLDALIERMHSLLGKDLYQKIFAFGLQAIEQDLRQDLENFGVCYQQWFHESELLENGSFEAGLEQLTQAGYTAEKEGALWFKASACGDEKDRVLTKSNGDHTYFAADIAYHLHKYQQGYDRIIDIFGADHHGYVSRIRGFLKALGCDDQKLSILLVQFVTLYRGKQRMAMSTRSGEFVTLRALYEEVGKDAARFFYVMRKMDQALDFDMELAKSQRNDNPVYYIQYAHARICAVFRQ